MAFRANLSLIIKRAVFCQYFPGEDFVFHALFFPHLPVIWGKITQCIKFFNMQLRFEIKFLLSVSRF